MTHMVSLDTSPPGVRHSEVLKAKMGLSRYECGSGVGVRTVNVLGREGRASGGCGCRMSARNGGGEWLPTIVTRSDMR